MIVAQPKTIEAAKDALLFKHRSPNVRGKNFIDDKEWRDIQANCYEAVCEVERTGQPCDWIVWPYRQG